MSKQGRKILPSVKTKFESFTKRYMQDTVESTKKQRNRNVNEVEHEKKRSPLKSPRLCEEEPEICFPNNGYLKMELKQNYYPQKYDDRVQTKWREKETYFQNPPHDDVPDSGDHKPRPPSGSPSSKKLRKQRLLAPQTSEKYEECREKAERANENEWLSVNKRINKENVPCKRKNFEDQLPVKGEHKRCKMQLTVKQKEIDKLKNIIEHMSKPYEAKMLRYEENNSKKIDDLQKKLKIYEADLLDAKSKLKEANKTAEQLILKAQEKGNDLVELRLKYNRLLKGIEEYKKMKELSVEREKQIEEQQKEFEKTCKRFGKYKEVNDALSAKNDEMEDRIMKLQTKLNHLERIGGTHQLCLEVRDQQSIYIKDLETEVDAHENNNFLLQKEFDELNCSYNIMKAENAKVKYLQTELDAKSEEVNKLTLQLIRIENLSKECEKQRQTREKSEHEMTELEQVVQKKTNEMEALNARLEEFSKKCSALHRDKEEAHVKISALTDALYCKNREFESLTNQLERSETHVSVLNSRIDEMQKMNTDAVDRSKSIFQNENVSFKFAYEQATFKIKDLSKQLTNGKRDKENAEKQIDSLSNTLFHKEKELESVQNELARSEKNVSILLKDIKDIQASERLADQKLQVLQSENTSLKSALSNEIDDFLKKGTSLQKYKTDAEHKTSTLVNALKEKETEIEALSKQLARAEEKVSTLSQDIVDIQASKRLVAEVKLQNLQTENVSLKSALSKATNEIEDLLNKGTNLQKYKTDAEHKTSTLMNALKEKETEIEALSKQLERAEKNVSILSQDIKDIQASKRQVAGEKLQGLQTENASLKSALSKATNEIEDLLNKGTNLQKYKTDAEHKTSTLKNAMKEKESENEALREQLARAEKNVSILSQDIKDTQASKRQVAEEKLQDLQTENASLKSALSKATNEIEDLLNKGTNLQKYKTDAEHKTSTLMNVLKEKETEIKALSKQLARSEENVSILSKDIKNIKESKRQVADEKLQDLQTENASLKLTLAEATTEIDDLWNKCTNLQKYKSDTELEIRTLLNTIEEKETEIETLHKHLARSEKHVSNLSKDIKDIEGSKRQAADEKLQGLKTENASLKSALAEATNEIDALRNKCTNLQKYKTDTEHTINTMFNAAKEKETEFETLNRQLTRENNELSKDISNLKKDKENAENQRQSFSKALKEKEKEIEIMRNDIARYTEKISTLTKNVEDIKGSKNQAADENIKGLQKKIRSLESDFRSATADMNDLSYKYKCLQKDKECAEYTIKKLSNTVQEKEKEINSLIEDLAKANVDSEEYIASAYSIQKLKDENAFLKSDLSQLSHETEKKVSALTKEIKSQQQKTKGTNSEEYNARKLHDENEFLKAQLDRTSRSYEQLRKDYNEVKREKDHALNRLTSVAEEKLSNNKPGIADLSDENRPINLGEKFSQLYDDQWTDAIEHLEEMGYSETDGIRCLLDILKAVFDECVKLSDIHFNQLKELTGTSHLPSDQLNKLKALRKATAIHSVVKTKQLVNDYMSKAFSKEKAACQTYIDRSIELCWLMSVQDPPVVIDFIAVHGQAIDDKILRKFTKTGSKINFLVWPVIRLHKNGPLLQKGVVETI